MTDLQRKMRSRWSGPWFLKAGALVALAGAAPLLLYILLGPADGNPIGLGLLMVAAVLAGLFLAGIGLLKLLVTYFQQHG